MIIDNDKYVRESLSTFFEQGERKFLIFQSAREGLNSLKYQSFAVVISDYFLPDMNGLSFLDQVGKLHPQISRILMSTIVTDELRIQAEESRIDVLLEKPLNAASIDKILNETLKKCSPPKTSGDKQ